jgi:hypothetical protein
LHRRLNKHNFVTCFVLKICFGVIFRKIFLKKNLKKDLESKKKVKTFALPIRRQVKREKRKRDKGGTESKGGVKKKIKFFSLKFGDKKKDFYLCAPK